MCEEEEDTRDSTSRMDHQGAPPHRNCASAVAVVPVFPRLLTSNRSPFRSLPLERHLLAPPVQEVPSWFVYCMSPEGHVQNSRTYMPRYMNQTNHFGIRDGISIANQSGEVVHLLKPRLPLHTKREWITADPNIEMLWDSPSAVWMAD